MGDNEPHTNGVNGGGESDDEVKMINPSDGGNFDDENDKIDNAPNQQGKGEWWWGKFLTSDNFDGKKDNYDAIFSIKNKVAALLD